MARLPDMINARDSFHRADSFLLMYIFGESQPPDFVGPRLFAHFTTAAFCVELYMKILAQTERGTPPLEGHDLHKLAHDLSSASYRRIKRAWKKANAKSHKAMRERRDIPEWSRFTDDFELELKKSSKAFMWFRYDRPEKHKNDPPYWSLGGVAVELRKIIVELNPDWMSDSDVARVALDPHTKFAAAENKELGRPTGWAILNQQPTALDVQLWRRSYPENGRARKGS